MRKLTHFLPFILAVVLAGFLAYQNTTTRGHVISHAGEPIGGADVVLADSTRVVAHATTNGGGHFRFIHPPHDRERYQILICAPRHSALRSSAPGAALQATYGLNPVEQDSFSTPDRLGWNLPVPPSCPGGESGWSDAGPFSSFTSSDHGGPMDIVAAFGSLAFVLVVLLLYALPLLLIAWLIRTFIRMRRDQVRMLQLVSSIEAELRRRGSHGP